MTSAPKQQFIVAELSKNWIGKRGAYVPLKDGPLIANLFEDAIAHNLARGYRLHSFQFQRFKMAPDEMNESLIAVFELDPTHALAG